MLLLAVALVGLGCIAGGTRAEDFPFSGIWSGATESGDQGTWTARVDTDGNINVVANMYWLTIFGGAGCCRAACMMNVAALSTVAGKIEPT